MEKPVYFYNHQEEKLVGTLHLPDKPSDCGIILGHCFTCSRHTLILREIGKRLAEHGFTALRFDFSGNGQSEGDFAQSSYTKHISEMKQAAAFLSDRGITRLGLAGHSMGAAIAVLAASRTENITAVCALAGRLGEKDPSRLFSEAQLAQLRENGKLSFVSRGRTLELSEGFFSDMRRYDLPEAVAALKMPLMVVHGDSDEIIPVQNAYQAREKNPDARLEIIHGADHMFSDPAHRTRIADMVTQWFEESFFGKHSHQ